MYSFGGRLKSLRTENKLTQEELVKQINAKFDLHINKGMLSKWESNKVEPRLNIVRALALFFDVSLDFLLGLDEFRNEKNMYTSSKVEQNLQNELLKVIEGINTGSCTVFESSSKYEIDEEDKELLVASLENTLRLAKRIAQQK